MVLQDKLCTIKELPKWVLEDCFIHDDSFVSFREFFDELKKMKYGQYNH